MNSLLLEKLVYSQQLPQVIVFGKILKISDITTKNILKNFNKYLVKEILAKQVFF